LKDHLIEHNADCSKSLLETLPSLKNVGNPELRRAQECFVPWIMPLLLKRKDRFSGVKGSAVVGLFDFSEIRKNGHVLVLGGRLEKRSYGSYSHLAEKSVCQICYNGVNEDVMKGSPEGHLICIHHADPSMHVNDQLMNLINVGNKDLLRKIRLKRLEFMIGCQLPEGVDPLLGKSSVRVDHIIEGEPLFSVDISAANRLGAPASSAPMALPASPAPPIAPPPFQPVALPALPYSPAPPIAPPPFPSMALLASPDMPDSPAHSCPERCARWSRSCGRHTFRSPWCRN